MNTKPRFQLRLSPEAELNHLVRLTSGLLASGQCIPNADHSSGKGGVDGELPVARVVARELLEQLRQDVEEHVTQDPEAYGFIEEAFTTHDLPPAH